MNMWSIRKLLRNSNFASKASAPRLHVQRDRMLAKFWLKPVALASSTRFSPKDLRKLELLVVENKDIFLEAWNEHFSS